VAEPSGPGGPPGRRAVLAALLAAAGTSLAGCARIPTSGPVETHTENVAGEDNLVRRLPPPPRRGALPEEIVAGFLGAAAVGGTDGGDARAYLADGDVDWDPGVGIVLHDGPARPRVVSGEGAPADRPTGTASPSPAASTPREGAKARVVVPVQAVAVLDRDGRLSQYDSPQGEARTFDLVVRRGEWRIVGLDDGVVMSLTQFVLSTYRAVPVYFPDRTGLWLVPDVRYIRQGTDATQTEVVGALLDGPSGWLRDAVSVPPVQPRLTVSSVPVAGNVATVDLDEKALTLDERWQAVLQAQLERSLAAVRVRAPFIARVELTVGGRRLPGTVGAGGGLATSTARALPEPASAARAGSVFVGTDAQARLVTVEDGQTAAVVADLDLGGGARPAMSYSDSPRSFALLVQGKAARALKVAPVGGAVAEIVTGPDLTAPSFDTAGWVWTSLRSPRGSVVAGTVVGGRVRRLDVDAPWLRSGQVVSLRISREGARALLVLDTVRADGRRASTLLLSGVQRRVNGDPVALGPPVRLLTDLARATDAVWVDDMNVAVLGTRRSGKVVLPVQPWVVDVGGDPSARGVGVTAPLLSIVKDEADAQVKTADQWERLPVDAAPTLAVGDGRTAIYVGTAKGDVFHFRQSGSWERVKAVVLRPAFPG
jgi:hypothetical protein